MSIENNKLIAEFMGGTPSSVPNLINLPQTRGDANIHSVKGSELLPNGTYSVHRLNELEYHSSWDWLMPVIEKIEEIFIDDSNLTIKEHRYDFNIKHTQCEIYDYVKDCVVASGDMGSKILSTYVSILQFIIEYNIPNNKRT